MPYNLVKRKDGWWVLGPDGKPRHRKPYRSKKAALPYFRKLYAIEHGTARQS